MAFVQIIGKKGSKARKRISENTGIKLYTGKSIPDLVINYGLAGKSMEAALLKHKRLKSIPTLNKRSGLAKNFVVSKVSDSGIAAPETKSTLNKNDILDEWIEKRCQSSCGKGIKKAAGKRRLPGKYYQKFISDRKYELRVHAFSWLPIEDWPVFKRVGPEDQIAWNFSQGGKFITVNNHNVGLFTEAKEISKKVLETLHMDFGAVDLIVTKKQEVLFIEINSCPGFENLAGQIYFDAFSKLKAMKAKELRKFVKD